MASREISVEADGIGGDVMEKLSDLVAKRASALRYETTVSAVTATAINILSSLRARTRVSKVSRGDFGAVVAPAPGVVAGWKSDGKGTPKRNARRVVRTIGGHEMASSLVVNLAGPYRRGERPLCFVVVSKFKRTVGASEKYERVYVIARNAKEVREWANRRQREYVRRFAGMAKWAIGQAQSRISAAAVKGDSASEEAQQTALKHLVVKAEGGGAASGSYAVSVEDGLGYSMAALKGGAADFDLALKKAANRTAAIINRLGGRRLEDELPTPFPEVKGRRGG